MTTLNIKKTFCKIGLRNHFLSLISFLYICSLIICLLFVATAISGNAVAGEKAELGIQVQKLEGTVQWRFLGRFTGRSDGVLVSQVIQGSPAEQMGVKKDDVIVSFNYKDLKTTNEFVDAVAALNNGDKVVFSIFRMSPTLLTIEGTMGQAASVAATQQTPKSSKEAKQESADVSAKIFAPTGHHEVSSVAFSPDGKFILSAGNMKNSLQLWDSATGKEIRTFIGDADAVYSAAVSPDGKYVLTGSANQTMKLWDAATGKEVKAFTGNSKDDLISSVAFSPDGLYALSGGSDRTLKLWDIATGKEVRTFTGHKGWVSSVAFSSDGKYALSGSWDRTIKLWDIATGREIKTFNGQALIDSVASDFTKDGERIPALIRAIGEKGMFNTSDPRISCVAFSPDGKYALSGSWNTTLTLWNISADKQITQTSRGRRSQDNSIVRTFTGHTDRVNAIAFSPDGSQIISASRDNSIKLWDAATGRGIRTFKGHKGDINSIAFSNDAKSFISGGSDGTVRLWDIKTGEEISQFVSLKDGEWIVITPEGYYNSSPNGHKYLNIRMGNKVYGIEQFYDVFYRPDIVAAKLRGDDVRSLITLTIDDAIKNPPPTVEFTAVPSATDQSIVKVCFKIKSTGGGIGEVRLFHNGKLIESDGYYKDVAKTSEKMQLASLTSDKIYEDMRSVKIKGVGETSPIKSNAKGEEFEDCKKVDAIPGENEISLSAFNSSNTVQSFMQTAKFNSTIKPEEPHLYILSIGIDQYKDTSVNLKYALKDARDIKAKLLSQSATLYKTQNIHHELLLDKDATKTNILNRINEISQKIKPSDSFILFVAGHGILLQNQYYMLTSEYDGNINEKTMISSNEIVEMSKRIKSLSQLFIFDTCHAGGVDYIVSGLYDARMSVLAKKMGLHIYASANDKQAAMDGYKGNGLFTYVLLNGLNNNKEADKNKDGKVTVVGLGEYSKKMTTEISKEVGHSQTPLIINFGKDSPIYKLQ